MSAIRCGVIGAGARIRNLLKRVRAVCPELQLELVHDPEPASIERFKDELSVEPRVVGDPLDLAGDPQLDWIFIGSPNHAHAGQAIAALDAGKHVFCEKPLALSLEDGLAMREAVRRSGRHFVLGFTLRFSPHYRRIAQLVHDGAIGRPISFEFNETLHPEHGGYIHADWRRYRRLAGSHMLEKCCHDLDVANWVIGARVRRVGSFGGLKVFTAENARLADLVGPHPETGARPFQTWHNSGVSPFNNDKDIFDHQVSILEYDSGVRACFHTNACCTLPERRIVLVGDEGAIRADVIHGTIEHNRIGWSEKPRIFEEAAGGHGGGDEILAEELRRCMLEGVDPEVGVQAGLEAAVTAFAIDRAADEGGIVDLSEDWKRVDADAG